MTDPDRHTVVEPVPAERDFERLALGYYEHDVAAQSVVRALDQLGWETGMSPQPILCVHPLWFAAACQIARDMYEVVRPVALRGIEPDEDAWFVAWRGRRVGSEGA